MVAKTADVAQAEAVAVERDDLGEAAVCRATRPAIGPHGAEMDVSRDASVASCSRTGAGAASARAVGELERVGGGPLGGGRAPPGIVARAAPALRRDLRGRPRPSQTTTSPPAERIVVPLPQL
jgi:hypothetical protein